MVVIMHVIVEDFQHRVQGLGEGGEIVSMVHSINQNCRTRYKLWLLERCEIRIYASCENIPRNFSTLRSGTDLHLPNNIAELRCDFAHQTVEISRGWVNP